MLNVETAELANYLVTLPDGAAPDAGELKRLGASPEEAEAICSGHNRGPIALNLVGVSFDDVFARYFGGRS
ncbi:hypothetical protein [Bradyrhizobium sp. RDM4]|uniref:hypothetical protein n=1 Tax=Bradyrhizobium sp. RDM4 TaxID=3378765 RepID=UPI0038FCB7BF